MKLILEIAQVEILQKHQKHKITGFGKTPLVAQREHRHLHKLNARIFNSTQKQIYYARAFFRLPKKEAFPFQYFN